MRKPTPKPQARSGAVPFYERNAAARALRATTMRASDLIGLHAICPRQTCRRARACRDRDPRDRAFCTYHYVGILRFVLQLAAATEGGTKPVRDAEAPDDAGALARALAVRQAEFVAPRDRRVAPPGRGRARSVGA